MKEERVGLPISIGEITVIPLEKVSIYHLDTDDGLAIYYSKEPVGIAVNSPLRKWAVDITDGEEVPIEFYYDKFTDLRQILNNL